MAFKLKELLIARKEYQEIVNQGAGQDVLVKCNKRIVDAELAQAQIVRENKVAEFKAGTEATGMIVGSAFGGALGSLFGSIGTMIGSIIGGMAGTKIGEIIGEDRAENYVDKTATKLNTAFVDRIVSEKLNAFINDLFGGTNVTHVAELTDTQPAQQEAMERGKIIKEKTSPLKTSLNVDSLNENSSNQLEGLGESISENLSSALEGVNEIFSGLGESITESLTSITESISEVFTGLGESISENLS